MGEGAPRRHGDRAPSARVHPRGPSEGLPPMNLETTGLGHPLGAPFQFKDRRHWGHTVLI